MLKNKLNRILLVAAFLGTILLFHQCKKDTATEPPTPTNVKFLGHKGSGSTTYHPSNIENTLPAVQTGLKTMNGVEVDLQMSLDGTIWLYHDLDLSTSTCSKISSKTIILSRDSEISALNICSPDTKDRIYKLSELLAYWNQAAAPFYISMHIKLDFPHDSINKPVIGGEAMYLAKMADNLAKILPLVKSPGKLILEVFDATFCGRIHQLIPGIKVCQIKEVTFPRQIDDAKLSNYDGVSASFDLSTLTAEAVASAQASGLIVQLWTPDSKEELALALKYNPDFIQTDNLNAMSDLNVVAK